jgi:hypothetical protein
MDRHLTILLIILVLSVTFIGLNIKEDFSPGYLYIPVKNTKTPFSKIFNIDDEINKQSQNLGWKSFWRKNYSQFSDNLNTVYKDNHLDKHPGKRLLFDGIRNAQENSI